MTPVNTASCANAGRGSARRIANETRQIPFLRDMEPSVLAGNPRLQSIEDGMIGRVKAGCSPLPIVDAKHPRAKARARQIDPATTRGQQASVASPPLCI